MSFCVLWHIGGRGATLMNSNGLLPPNSISGNIIPIENTKQRFCTCFSANVFVLGFSSDLFFFLNWFSTDLLIFSDSSTLEDLNIFFFGKTKFWKQWHNWQAPKTNYCWGMRPGPQFSFVLGFCCFSSLEKEFLGRWIFIKFVLGVRHG